MNILRINLYVPSWDAKGGKSNTPTRRSEVFVLPPRNKTNISGQRQKIAITIDMDEHNYWKSSTSSYYLQLFDEKKKDRVEQIIRIMARTGKAKSWLIDELARNKATAALPIVSQMDLLEILHLCPDHVLTRILAILKGIEYDYSLAQEKRQEHSRTSGAAGDSEDSTLGSVFTDLAESLSFVLCLKVKGRSNLRYVLKDRELENSTRMAMSRAFGMDAIPDSDERPHDDEIFGGCLRTYMYVGRNPACTLSEIARGTRLGDLAPLAISELLAQRIILEDFSDTEQLYFAPHFADVLCRLIINLDFEEKHQDQHDSDGWRAMPFDSYVRLLVELLLPQGTEKEYECRIQPESGERAESKVERDNALPSLLGQIPAAEFDRWLEVSARGKSSERGNNSDADLVHEIGWMYSKLGLAAPRVVIANSLAEYFGSVLQEDEDLFKFYSAFKASLPAGDGRSWPLMASLIVTQNLASRIGRLQRRTDAAAEAGVEGLMEAQIMANQSRSGQLPDGNDLRQRERMDRIRVQARRRVAAMRNRPNTMQPPTFQPQVMTAAGSLSPLHSPETLEFYKNEFSTKPADENRDGPIQDRRGSGLVSAINNWQLRQRWLGLEQQPLTGAMVFAALRNLKAISWPDNRIACFRFLRKITPLTPADLDRYLQMLTAGQGIWDIYLRRNIAIVCRPPAKVLTDARGRLHSTEEAAVQWLRDENDPKDQEYASRLEEYFLHGVRFERELWEKVVNGEISCADILALDNMEQRFAALRLYGPERMLKELSAKRMSRSMRGNELYELRGLPNTGLPLKLLKYRDLSTDREYVSFVPEPFEDADDAMAWKFSLTREEYDNLKSET